MGRIGVRIRDMPFRRRTAPTRSRKDSLLSLSVLSDFALPYLALLVLIFMGV
jgi:hypothetical protein